MIEMEGNGEKIVKLPWGSRWHSIHEQEFHWGKSEVLDCTGRIVPSDEYAVIDIAVGTPTCKSCLRRRR